MTGNLAADDFERLHDAILTNKRWLLENKELFVLVALSYGRFFKTKFGAENHILPIKIVDMIIDIHQKSRVMGRCLQ